jgi:hypothetical protein
MADLNPLKTSLQALADQIDAEGPATAAALLTATRARADHDAQSVLVHGLLAVMNGGAAVAKVEAEFAASPYRKWYEIGAAVVLLGVLVGGYFLIRH